MSVATMSGRTIKAAPDHPFFDAARLDRGWRSRSWKDYVGIPRVDEEFGDSSMSPEEARLLGYLVGDGCISQRSLAFVNADREVIEDFMRCAQACGFTQRIRRMTMKRWLLGKSY